MMHGPPEAEGSKATINLPMFVPADPSMTMSAKYAPDGADPCPHPWGAVQYPTFHICARCGVVTG